MLNLQKNSQSRSNAGGYDELVEKLPFYCSLIEGVPFVLLHDHQDLRSGN